MARAVPNPDPGAFEDELARELAPLLTAGYLVPPGGDGKAELRRFAAVVGAAATRYGRLIAGERSAENFLLAQSPADPDRPSRLVAAVCEGNYKAPVTVIGGTIALCELYRHVFTRAGDSVEDDVRLALVETLQRLQRINRAEPPHRLTRWHFHNSNSSTTSEITELATSFTALIVEGREVLLAHVGECHAYRVTPHSRQLQRLSADHTLAADPQHAGVADLIYWMGDLPRCVLGLCQLTDLQLEWFPLGPGDTLLLCSSSLRKGALGDDELAQLLLDHEPETACTKLMALAPLAERPDLSATVIVVRSE